jgi:hypothetical protein
MYWFRQLFRNKFYRIGGIMVSVLASSAVDRGVKPRSGLQTFLRGLIYVR